MSNQCLSFGLDLRKMERSALPALISMVASKIEIVCLDADDAP